MRTSLLDEAAEPGPRPDSAPSRERPAPALVVLGTENAPVCADGACPL
ncbi:hypothetical protein KQY30_35750 [Streptomyces sp. GMY02]|nr:hypothetical protein [Streptomyces sp. GMY02]QXE38767.1 hypothetical protein KQY30_35750 [Streptomyces sp. GMY02]